MIFSFDYPNNIKWSKPELKTNNIFEYYSKSTASKIRKCIKQVKDSNLSFVVEKVDEEFLNLFTPIYKQNMITKDNPNIIDIKSRILSKIQEGDQYKSVSLYQNNVLIGAQIFNDRETKTSIAFLTFPKEVEGVIPKNISLAADYYYTQYGFENNKYTMGGKDRNIYGQNLSIGLFHFKLMTGYFPSSSKTTTIENRFELKGENDILIALETELNKPIKKVKLFTYIEDDQVIKNKYGSILKSQFFDTEIIKIPQN